MKKILLVDDEDLLLQTLAVRLRQAGYSVTAVGNGQDALMEVGRSLYDLCFLDIQLPDANGLDLMNIIRKISPATKIIIMTALDLTESELLHLGENSCDFLSKPFDLEKADSLVESTMKSRGSK